MSESVASPAAEKRAHLWDRDPLDWYVEPPSATRALLTVEKFVGGVWDPACGQGNIVEMMLSTGFHAVGTDIKRRAAIGLWWLGERDFLKPQPMPVGFANIVTNPPFFRAKGAEAFIRQALALARGKVAVFTDIRFIAGADRAEGLFAEHPPARIWIVTPRVSCPPGAYLAAGNKAGNGSSDWCWLVWDLTAPKTATSLGWLRRQAA